MTLSVYKGRICCASIEAVESPSLSADFDRVVKLLEQLNIAVEGAKEAVSNFNYSPFEEVLNENGDKIVNLISSGFASNEVLAPLLENIKDAIDSLPASIKTALGDVVTVVNVAAENLEKTGDTLSDIAVTLESIATGSSWKSYDHQIPLQAIAPEGIVIEIPEGVYELSVVFDACGCDELHIGKEYETVLMHGDEEYKYDPLAQNIHYVQPMVKGKPQTRGEQLLTIPAIPEAVYTLEAKSDRPLPEAKSWVKVEPATESEKAA